MELLHPEVDGKANYEALLTLTSKFYDPRFNRLFVQAVPEKPYCRFRSGKCRRLSSETHPQRESHPEDRGVLVYDRTRRVESRCSRIAAEHALSGRVLHGDHKGLFLI